MKKLTVLSICVALLFCVSFATSAVASDEEDVLNVMNKWFKAFNTNDYELMNSLWWHSPKLTTFGPGGAFLNQGWDDETWKSNLDFPQGTINNTLHHPQVTMLTNDFAIITGYNAQTSTDSTTNQESTSYIRGTFVVQKIGGKWLIVHEHSSMFSTE